jgi:hypothetical protein
MFCILSNPPKAVTSVALARYPVFWRALRMRGFYTIHTQADYDA